MSDEGVPEMVEKVDALFAAMAESITQTEAYQDAMRAAIFDGAIIRVVADADGEVQFVPIKPEDYCLPALSPTGDGG